MNIVHFILKSMLISLFFSEVDARRKKHRHDGRASNHILKKHTGITICQSSAKYAFDDSMFLLPTFDGIKPEAKDRSKSLVMRVSPVNDTKCPEGYTNSPHRSTCPHHHALNYEANRIPSMVFEAECSCTNCLTKHGEGQNACAKVFTYRTVLIKKDGENCYERHIQGFAVGCHCIGISRLSSFGAKSDD